LVRAVIFDFGNVVSAFDTSKFLRRLAARSPLAVDELSAAVYGSGLHARYEAGAISSPAFFREVVARCRVEMGMPEFIDAFTDIFEPVEGTADLIRRVAAHRPAGLLSNTNPWHFRFHIRKSPAWPYYSTVTLSYRLRSVKPEPAIYADAVRKLGLTPAECAYVDDIPEYAEGATRAGLRGIVFTGAARLEADLQALGVDTR
jgi:putative hydrolase of the HAD superfamily